MSTSESKTIDNKITSEMDKCETGTDNQGSNEMKSNIVMNEEALNQVFGKPAGEEKTENPLVLHYKEILLTTLVYSIFYTFCLYKNLSGITMPFFISGSYCYLICSMKKMNVSFKKDAISLFQLIGSVLLGISTFLTDSGPIHVFNFIGFLLLLGSFMLHQIYEDSLWGFGKYLGSLLYTALCALGHIFDPFIDCSAFLQKQREKKAQAGEEQKEHKGKYVIYGLLILLPLLIIVVALLASADVVFGNLLSQMFMNITIPEHIMGIIFLTIFAFFAAYCYLAAVLSRPVSDMVHDFKHGEPIMAITITSVLAVVYFLFSLIQIIYLFGGAMALQEGYTYAEYARQGFFQLLFVCVINLVLVLVCLTCFKENKALKIILTIISACTFIMIASSAYRMLLYVSIYFLTFLRVLVLWSLVLLTILLAGVFVSIFKAEFPLFKYCMLAVTIMYLGLSFSHQDYWIARYNVNAVTAEGKDVMTDSRLHYLGSLSLDAVPVYADIEINEVPDYENPAYADVSMQEAPATFADFVPSIEKIERECGNMSFRTFNLSKWIALKCVK